MSDFTDYNEFNTGILDQLLQNRENHKKSHDKSIERMALIGGEQMGQLQIAVEREDWKNVDKEVFHVAAILFEIWERARDKRNQ